MSSSSKGLHMSPPPSTNNHCHHPKIFFLRPFVLGLSNLIQFATLIKFAFTLQVTLVYFIFIYAHCLDLSATDAVYDIFENFVELSEVHLLIAIRSNSTFFPFLNRMLVFLQIMFPQF